MYVRACICVHMYVDVHLLRVLVGLQVEVSGLRISDFSPLWQNQFDSNSFRRRSAGPRTD